METTGENGEKRWKIQFRCTELKFTWDELVAVYIGRRFFDPMKGTCLWAAMKSAMNKMERCLGEKVNDIERLASTIQLVPSGVGDYHSQTERIDDLNIAIEDHIRVRFNYQSIEDVKNGSNATPVTVEPYGMVWHEGGLYLIGWSHKRQAIRHWKLDRMQRVVLLHEKCQIPESFSLSN